LRTFDQRFNEYSQRGAQRAGAAVMTEALIQSSLHTACTIATKSTTAPKTAPSSWSQRKKWSKIPRNLSSNQHPEKLTTPCNGALTTNNILNPILRSFHHKITKIAKVRHITNPTTMPQPIIRNLHQLHK
jgi:hypothetical protein